MKSEALLIGNRNLCDEKKEILKELLFRMDAVKTAEDKKYVLMNAPNTSPPVPTASPSGSSYPEAPG